MAACEEVLASTPNHAEALVWHGSGLAFNAGQAFQKGDMKTGGELWQRGMEEMDKAVALEPDNVGVRIPRGALLLQATRNMPPDMGRPLLEKGVGDYEHVLALQSAYFNTLGDHPKGELLFGLAEGYSRLGRAEKARGYFDRLIADAPTSGRCPRRRRGSRPASCRRAPGSGASAATSNRSMAIRNDSALRYWLRMAVGLVSAAAVVTVSFNGVSWQTPWRKAMEAFLVSLLFSFCIGPPVATILPRIGHVLWRRFRFPLNWAIMIAVMMTMAAGGSLWPSASWPRSATSRAAR